jgi:transcription elongation GreA/GreB family factor
MSRAFVKENDDAPPGADVPERRVSDAPNYVTAAGLAQLERQLGQLEERRGALLGEAAAAGVGDDDPGLTQGLAAVERDRRYFQLRLETARLIDSRAQPRDQVAFGASVTVRDEHGATRTFTIVGEDEADVSLFKVSYVSPLAQALTGARVGSSVLWRRPAGNLRLTIIAIVYD